MAQEITWQLQIKRELLHYKWRKNKKKTVFLIIYSLFEFTSQLQLEITRIVHVMFSPAVLTHENLLLYVKLCSLSAPVIAILDPF